MELRNPLFGGVKEDCCDLDDSFSAYSKQSKPLKFDRNNNDEQEKDDLAKLI